MTKLEINIVGFILLSGIVLYSVGNIVYLFYSIWKYNKRKK